MTATALFARTLLDFFEPVRRYLDDPEVTEIMINGPGEIYVERRGQILRTPARFASERDLVAALRNLAQYVGRHFGPDRPILEARLPDGSRVEAIMAPAAQEGPIVSVRRFSREPLTIAQLVAGGAMTRDLAEAVAALVACKQNIVVAGGTSSGKTSILGALSGLIPADDRIVVIEDASELRLQQPHVVRLEAQPPDAQGRGAVSVRDLFRATLRMRPDRILVGEVRGGEALDLVQAMTSGHGGCLTTLHATYPRDVMTRLETMSMMADIEMPLAAMRAQIASAVDIVVQGTRYRDGTRKVTHISEIIGFDMDTGKYVINDLFLRKVKGVDANGRVISKLYPTGNLPDCMETILASGMDVPQSVYEMKRRKEQKAQRGERGGGDLS